MTTVCNRVGIYQKIVTVPGHCPAERHSPLLLTYYPDHPLTKTYVHHAEMLQSNSQAADQNPCITVSPEERYG